MKLAIVQGERREPKKGLLGNCIGCEQPMVAKCGPIKIWHWAHKAICDCDRWWENETEWHRNWKNNFPTEYQEIRHKADSGEWHIADVKTKFGHILEFQHSFLKSDERQARNNFYGSSLVWIVDGLKKKNDLLRFNQLLKNARLINQSINLIQLPPHLDVCPTLQEWSGCNGPVFFDFGNDLPLWCLLPKSSATNRYIGPISRQSFVALHNGKLTPDGQSFSDLMKTLNDIIVGYENPRQQIAGLRNNVQLTWRPMIQRPVTIPQHPSQRHLYRLNHSPRRRGRF